MIEFNSNPSYLHQNRDHNHHHHLHCPPYSHYHHRHLQNNFQVMIDDYVLI